MAGLTVPDQGNAQRIQRILITEFMRPDALLDRTEPTAQPVRRLPVGEHWIAAPTAAVLNRCREVCIAGRHIPVAHFEQPAFA